MTGAHSDIHRDVAAYYSDKLARHGATASGVDWKNEESQHLRFAQLLRILGDDREAGVADIGCGYGAMLDYMRGKGYRGRYLGTDLSPEMIAAARARHAGDALADFACTAALPGKVDFVIASGIFNVRLGFAADSWQGYVDKTLDAFVGWASRGVAINFLTSYSDRHLQRDDLFYADPCRFFDRCKTRYARNVALLHDYDLYEFTLLIRLGQ